MRQDGFHYLLLSPSTLLCWLTGTPILIGPVPTDPQGGLSHIITRASKATGVLTTNGQLSPYGGLSKSFLCCHILLIIFPVLSNLFSLNNISTVCFILFIFLHASIISLSLFISNIGHVTKKCCKSSSSNPHSLHVLSWFLFLL